MIITETPTLLEIANNSGFSTIAEMMKAIKSGEATVIKHKWYSVVLTDAIAKYLTEKGVNCFVRGRNYLAFDEEKALEMFNKELNTNYDLFAVIIREI